MTLLSIGNDSKTVKGEKFGFVTGIQYFAPAHLAGNGINVCKFATVHCKAACLYSAGRGIMSNVQKARIARTQFWYANPTRFLAQLESEISALVKKAEKAGMRPAIRLNGTSDILWEKTGILERFPHVQFYDFTKYPAGLRQNLPGNYHLTYSFTGLAISAEFSDAWAKRGINTAVVFKVKKGEPLPAEFFGRPVIDGDLSDLRFADPAGCIVGLRAKGKARVGISPFVVEVKEGLAIWPAADPAAEKEVERIMAAAANLGKVTLKPMSIPVGTDPLEIKAWTA
jgi:hypothetical protein